jgi:hypothetical protein
MPEPLSAREYAVFQPEGAEIGPPVPAELSEI